MHPMSAPSMVNLPACVLLLLVPGEHRALCAVTSKIEKLGTPKHRRTRLFIRG
jgi:hypothetical protein